MDQRVLCELYRELNPADPPWPTDAAAADPLAKVLRHDGTTILIAEVDGIAVGRPFALVENVVTRQEYRKQGYGRQVVERAIEIAGQAGCYRVTLMTGSRREETLRFYEAAGLQRNTKTAFEKRFS